MKKFLVLIPVITLLMSSSSYSSEAPVNTDNSEDKEELVGIKKGSFVSSIKMVGDIEAKKQVYLAPSFSAKVEKLAEEGEKIKKGDLIAKLESKELQEELTNIELDAGIAKNDLIQMDKDSVAELVKLNSNILLAQKNVQLKKLELQKLIDDPTKEDLKKLDITIQLTKKALSLATSELEQKEKLVLKGVLKNKDILEQRLTVSKKQKEYKTALAEYEITKAGPTENSKNIARLEIQKAENSLEIEKENLLLRKEQIEIEKSKLRVKANVNQKKVEQLKSSIADSVLKAPADGTVVLSKVWGDTGLEKVKLGDTVYRGRPFVSIANLDDVIIKTQIEEQFIGKVKLGLFCNITSNNLKGKTFKGKISKIGLLAAEKNGEKSSEGSSKVFDLEVSLDKSVNIFKPGMSVDVEIVMKNIDNVLLVPNNAVYKDSSRNFVYLPGNVKKYITLGSSNENESIVETGLVNGDKVIIEKDSTEGA